jgi:hypothetical protein
LLFFPFWPKKKKQKKGEKGIAIKQNKKTPFCCIIKKCANLIPFLLSNKNPFTSNFPPVFFFFFYPSSHLPIQELHYHSHSHSHKKKVGFFFPEGSVASFFIIIFFSRKKTKENKKRQGKKREKKSWPAKKRAEEARKKKQKKAKKTPISHSLHSSIHHSISKISSRSFHQEKTKSVFFSCLFFLPLD